VREIVAACLESVEPTPGGLSARFRFPPDLQVFAAHFPGHPLVPAVFLIEAVRCAVARHEGGPRSIRRVDTAKFSAEVPPGAALTAVVELAPTAEGLRCSATFAGEMGTAASIRLTLGSQA
jgi:3-hydroxymyristoyl/3-hydroxydecanoyl-(acyl carrier protein) dehydratase